MKHLLFQAGGPQLFLDVLKVNYEGFVLLMAEFVIGSAQDGRRVDCRRNVWRPFMGCECSTLLGQPIPRAEQRLGRGCAEAHNDLWLDECYLGFKPLTAGADLGRIRLLVYPAFASFFKLEMLDDVRDVDLVSLNASFDQCSIEHLPRRPHKGKAFQVLIVSGLLADQNDRRRTRAGSRHGLRSMPIEVARRTLLNGHAESGKAAGRRHL